jgi:hypothetical protein
MIMKIAYVVAVDCGIGDADAANTRRSRVVGKSCVR